MNDVDFEKQLSVKLQSLEKNKLPERDLWTGIELGLATENKHVIPMGKSQKGYLLAASILLVAMLGWMASDINHSAINGEELVARLSTQHQQQKNALLVYFKDQPALTDNWQQQLAELDEAELAVKAALAQEPDNMALLKLLQNVYQQQISLIERVHSPKWSQI